MSAPSDSPESPDPLESPSEPSDAPPESPDATDETSGPSSACEPASSPSARDATDALDAADPSEEPDATDSPDAPDATDDPRLNDEFVRTVPRGERGDVTVVGVVHDHPASAYRSREIVRERDPHAVALEAPPLATPLYRVYARDSRTPPSFGGEMSAAAQAARECDADVVGVDAPTRGFLGRLARNCWRERASPATLRRVASGVASVTRHALICRGAAALADRTSLRVEVDDPVDHDCTRDDPPAVQARDEREQARRSQSLLRAFDAPRPVRLRDETREECMADGIDDLRSRGDVVAIVGLDHLEAVADRLAKD